MAFPRSFNMPSTMIFAMVRVNLVNPAALSDQHLVAEYNEILMLGAYIRIYPSIARLSPLKGFGVGGGVLTPGCTRG